MVPIPAAVLTLALVAGALCAVVSLPLVFAQGTRALRRSRLQAQLARAGEDGEGGTLAADLMRRGVTALRPLARQLLRIPWLRLRCECCAQALATRGHSTEASVVAELLLLAVGVITGVVSVLTGMPATALCVAALAVGLLFGKARKILDGWETRLVEQIPDALHSLSI
jgi:hypothetical protein